VVRSETYVNESANFQNFRSLAAYETYFGVIDDNREFLYRLFGFEKQISFSKNDGNIVLVQLFGIRIDDSAYDV
jgi:hypothetical protein